MPQAFDRASLLSAFDQIGEAARRDGAVLHVAVYGGSALMLASNFRYSSEDVDIAELAQPWPQWLTKAVAEIAGERGWADDWLNDAVDVHLSRLATLDGDHLEFGTFPRSDLDPGMVVYVPTAEYLLALKLKAIRVLDPVRGHQEAQDIVNLMKIAGAVTPEQAVQVMLKFFPRSATDSSKQLFLLKYFSNTMAASDAPEYPVAGNRTDNRG